MARILKGVDIIKLFNFFKKTQIKEEPIEEEPPIEENSFYKYFNEDEWKITYESKTVDVADWFSTWTWYIMIYRDKIGTHVIKTLNGGCDQYIINGKIIKLEDYLQVQMIQYANYLIDNLKAKEDKMQLDKEMKEAQEQVKLNKLVKEMLQSKE